MCVEIDDDFHLNGTNSLLCGDGGASIGLQTAANEVIFEAGASATNICDGLVIYRGAGAICDPTLGTAVVTGTGPTNLRPRAVNDNPKTAQNTALNISVLYFGLDDVDLDGATLEILQVGSNGAINDNTSVAGGTLSINDNGTPANFADDYVVYTPPAGFLGGDSFQYIIEDDDGATDTATVSITVACGSGSISTFTYTYATFESETNDVVDELEAEGAPDGLFAQIYNNNETLVLDFGQVYDAGTQYEITWRRRNTVGTGTAIIDLSESTLPASGFTNHPVSPENTDNVAFTTTVVTSNVDFRYIAFDKGNSSTVDYEIDAVGVRSGVSCVADTDEDGLANSVDTDDDNDGILDTDECGGSSQKVSFTYTGSDQTYNVPAGATTLSAKIWGAGGRGDPQATRGVGGAGGYTEFTIPVSSLTSTTLIVTVGEGGSSSTGSVTYGNGGAGASGGGRNYGSGGGMSAISYLTLATPGSVVDADLVAIAGGGGTAAEFTNAGSTAGAGGGTNGVAGSDSQPTTGGGGTQAAGGTSSGNAGSFLLGGNAVADGGAGGGGYYGGGSGFLFSGNEGLGGGGSGYTTPSVTSSTTTAGATQTPPNTGDADYVAGVGTGGNNGGASGGNGLVVIEVTITSCDTDNDGVINSLDLDSDGDGIADIIEAGGIDADGNGIVDNLTDTDGDGWSNIFDSDDGGTALAISDTDSDGLQNFIDIDSDDDGIADIIESQPTGTLISPSGSDSDGDGIDDSFDVDNGNSFTDPVNTDGTDNPDYIDTDSDNDLELDALEAFDTDNDGTANTLAAGTDTDNDGLDDNFDNVVGPNATTNVTNGGQNSSSFPNLDNSATTERDWREALDADNDGVLDSVDLDDDNDGIPDSDECLAESKAIFTYTGADQTYNIPAGATEIRAKIWGAGGRGDDRAGRGVGGAGGYTEFTIAGSSLTSNTLIITVGQGGNSSTGSVTYGNGGAGSSSTFNATLRNYGSGGGMSAISYRTLAIPGSVTDADLLGIAGGGGTMPAFTTAGTRAGEGGGSVGGTGTEPTAAANGTGGTQAAGGTSTNGNAGSYLLGGNSRENGGAGGGGYYGGGSGSIVSSNEGGGGGGSGYINPLTSSGQTIAGSVQTPPMQADADYVAGVGLGGNNNAGNGGNGLVVIEVTYGNDNDGDGILNCFDLDSDGDGIPDIIEAGGTDANQDGRVDNNLDSDDDGLADVFDTDDGGSALPDSDTDGDGVSNRVDVDSDNDGITDIVEAQFGVFTAPSGTDTDGDGIDDAYDSDDGGVDIIPNNQDGAGAADYLSLDSDGDGLFDWSEGFDDDGSQDALDDLILRADNFETAAGNPLYYINTDDADADGIPDWLEDDDADNLPNFLDFGSGFYYDSDGDGLVDLYDTDNFGVASTTPDGDADGLPDFRDIDNEISLPVTLLYFTAEKLDSQVNLKWVTLSEVNNDYFTILKSSNGKDFHKIATVNGNGTTTQQQTYQLTDFNPLEGQNYYKLLQTDFDGSQNEEGIRLVNFSQSSTDFIIYPNPNNGVELNLRFKEAKTNLFLHIYDAKGQMVFSKQFNSTNQGAEGFSFLQIDLNLSNGMYLLHLIDDTSSQSMQLIVKE